MVDYYKIGQRIRKYRKALGLSQETLAEMVNISLPHMSHIETGNTKLSLPVLVDLARALHVSTDCLLFDDTVEQKQAAIGDIQNLLDSCSVKQSQILAEILKSAKTAMDKYDPPMPVD